jgi:uncharacterized protein YkwD
MSCLTVRDRRAAVARCIAPALLLAPLALPALGIETTSCFSAADVPELMSQLDALRAAGGVCGGETMAPAPPLRWSAVLAGTARAHALEMAEHDRVSHDVADGRTLARRLTDGGYRFSLAGENVAGGQQAVSAVLADWRTSPAHCKAMLKAEFKDAGMACVRRASGVYRTHWVLHLGTPPPGPKP